jgi:hypothetical protein
LSKSASPINRKPEVSRRCEQKVDVILDGAQLQQIRELFATEISFVSAGGDNGKVVSY